MGFAEYPSQYAIESSFGSTSPPSIEVRNWAFRAREFVVFNPGADRIFVDLSSTTSACSTEKFIVASCSTYTWRNVMPKFAMFSTTSSNGVTYRVGAWG